MDWTSIILTGLFTGIVLLIANRSTNKAIRETEDWINSLNDESEHIHEKEDNGTD